MARASFQDDLRLPQDAVRRITAAAMEERVSWRSRLAVFPLGDWLPRPALAAAAALLVLLVGVQVLGTKNGPGTGSTEAVRIDMQVEPGGEVRLAWSDGRGRAYTVRKSNDPTGMSGSETHRVRGNKWVDSNPGTGSIVYYSVE